MKAALFILPIALLVSCGDHKDAFPKQFAGKWTFDIDSLHGDIERRDLSKAEKDALKVAFGETETNQTCTVTEDGVLRYPQLPSGVHIQLTLVSKTDKGYVFKEQNSMNTSVSEYSLNKLNDGVWTSILLDKAYKPSHPELPNTYWTNRVGGSL